MQLSRECRAQRFEAEKRGREAYYATWYTTGTGYPLQSNQPKIIFQFYKLNLPHEFLGKNMFSSLTSFPLFVLLPCEAVEGQIKVDAGVKNPV